jgi:hypothetical protein
MKKTKTILALAATAVLFSMGSCKKCAECHYDLNDTEVEIGEYCGDDLKEIEKSGYQVNGQTLEVHCHDH